MGRAFDFLPLSIKLETLGGVATPLVLRGTPLPATRSEVFSTASDGQSAVEVSLFLGESLLVKNSLEIGTFKLTGIPPAQRGGPQIRVEFSVNKSCSITARAGIQGTSVAAETKFDPPAELTKEFISEQLANAEAMRSAEEATLLKIEAKNRARTLLTQAEELLRKDPNSRLSEAVAELGLALEQDNGDAIRQKSDAIASIISVSSLTSGSFDFSDLFGAFDFGSPARSTAKKTVERRPATPRSHTAPTTRPAAQSQELRSSGPKYSLGKIFGGGEFTLDSQLCFVLMPFDAKFQPIYEDQIRPTIEKAGLRCERADEIKGPTVITWDIWERINRARFLVADLTGQNPNVFYELGLAHALGQDVILLTQSMDFVPFDLKTVRSIVYQYTPRGGQELQRRLSETIDSLMKSK